MAKLPIIGICIPCGNTWPTGFGVSLVNMITHISTTQLGVTLGGYQLFLEMGSVLSNSRTNLVHDAMRSGCDYCLFLDSDMVSPITIIEDLLKHNQSIVGVNYVKRVLPTEPTAIDFTGKRILSAGLSGLEPV